MSALLVLLLAACAPETEEPWLATVQGRIAAEARAIHADGNGWAADLPTRVARFDADGVRFLDAGDGAEVLHLQTTAWGRGTTRALAPSAPAPGACLAELDAAGDCIRRLELAHEGVTEWFVGRGDGIEQGWTVEARPAGRGELRFDVRVDGAREVEADRLTDGRGLAWRVEGITAWDADGRALPARAERGGAGLTVLVDDTDARYPIVVDPIYTSTAWVARGLASTGVYADAVADAGDVDGDGYDDVLVGGSGYASNTGRAYLYLGSAAGLATNAATVLTGTTAAEYFGSAVAGVGDVDHDGYDDVAIGAYGAGGGAGYAAVYHGSAAGLASTARTTLAGTGTDSFGYALGGAGDVDGDGYDDVVIGATNAGGSKGAAYVFLGSATGVASAPAATLTGAAAGDAFGHAATGAGDVDHDGYDDVLVTATGGLGAAYVYHGSAAGLETTATTSIVGTDGAYGYAAADAGDVNGDGYADIVVGAYTTGANQGSAFVYLGSAAGVSGTASTSLTGAGFDNFFGFSVASAGDVDHDGYDDVVVGAWGVNGRKGAAYLYPGSATGTSSTAAQTISGTTSSEHLGAAVSGAGDVNGDGYADVLVGAFGYSSSTGRATLYQGSASGIPATETSAVEGTSASEYFAFCVAGAGDVNADGYDDVLVGAYGSGGTGKVYVYQGTAAGLSTRASATLSGESASSSFGFSAAGAGDVNGDGYDDVIVGAYGYSSATGRAYVYLGTAGGLASSPGFTLTGGGTGNNFGYSVAGAGDVDHDGYDDVIVGAKGYSSSTGRVYVHHGSAAGVATSPRTTLTGEAAASSFGAAVAGAGDVNADGYDDVIVGAYGYSSLLGRAYVYLGSAAGTASSPATTLTGDSAGGSFGRSVAGVGDVNADGYADIGVGAWYASSGYGKAFVYHGSAGGIPTTATTTFSGTVAYEYVGMSVAGAGDVDHDGYDDVVIGASGYSSTTGRAQLYAGGAAGLDTTAFATLIGEGTADAFGYTVAGAGDVDGDGYADVIIGAYMDNAYGGSAYLYRGYGDADGDGINGDTDCDDADASVGEPTARYVDEDGDGFGGELGAACPGAPGFVDIGGDCDDTDAAVLPGATEVCDGADDDCDGTVDEDAGSVWYLDLDGDGHAGTTSVVACDAPVGASAATDDCDDGDATVSPAAADVCDGRDNNCDGLVDEVGDTVWYVDADGDGVGGSSTIVSCDAPFGYVAESGDCDDGDPAVSPTGTDVCDGLDNDCDGLVDEVGDTVWYVDADGDGVGGSATIVACDAPAGYVAGSGDCDDSNAAVSPSATETCNYADDDCDGAVDEGVTGVWYADADGDGWVDYDLVATGCSAPAGYTKLSSEEDCADEDASVHPGATEIVDDGVDQDCDGADLVSDDTGDTGVDTGGDTAVETGDSGDSAVDTGGDTAVDTGDSGDTGVDSGGDTAVETGDSAVAADSDTGKAVEGGCGCRTGAPPSGVFLLVAVLAARRRR